jgi:DnaK suppressor protein
MPTAKKAAAPAAKATKIVKAAIKPSAAPIDRTIAPEHPVPEDTWLANQQQLLYAARIERLEEAEALKAEADQLAIDAEPGDTQFDDESGEGSTTAVDRERDLVLAQQARAEVQEIDHALEKIDAGTYGTCEKCAKPIPKPRLEVIPWASLCVNCKSGGLSARR